jgi:hypothetical protein
VHAVPDPTLTAALEAALLRELSIAWAELNVSLFRRALRPPRLLLSESTARLGLWNADDRTITIARALVLAHPWGAVIEVLKHEMAHQYVHEGLGVRDEAAHGPAFQMICERLAIDPAASGLPTVSGTASHEEVRVLERIAKLLALAESGNVHEAEAAMTAAQRLMLRHNLDAAARRTDRAYRYRHLGAPTGRVAEHDRVLAAILGDHFFVEVIWVPVYRPLEGKRGSVLEICGTESNVEMASYVHAFLSRTAEQLWLEHKQTEGIRGNRDRRTFLAGVMAGFLEKLRRQKRDAQEEGLVWVGDADLKGYYRRRHPHIQHTRHVGNRRTEAHAHGRAAGRRIVLHRPVEAARDVGGGRLLPGPRR